MSNMLVQRISGMKALYEQMGSRPICFAKAEPIEIANQALIAQDRVLKSRLWQKAEKPFRHLKRAGVLIWNIVLIRPQARTGKLSHAKPDLVVLIDSNGGQLAQWLWAVGKNRENRLKNILNKIFQTELNQNMIKRVRWVLKHAQHACSPE